MKYQEYKFSMSNSFELKDIFDCGQCFRWNKENDETYTGVIKDGVLNIKKEETTIFIKGNLNRDIKDVVQEYFDLGKDYQKIKKEFANIDTFMKESTEFGEGIRILNQDLWECIISFIISANNNIPRIKKIIESLSKSYGRKVEFENKEYYLFPTPEELSIATVHDLRSHGLGFRDIRVYETIRKVLNKEIDLEKIKKIDDSEKIKEELLKLDGVGPKVADCIMLFSMQRYDVFPIDVWVRRVMNDLYIKCEKEENVSKKEILKLASEKFGNLAGIAQQYLFYWRREQ